MKSPTNQDHRKHNGQLNILMDTFENVRKDIVTGFKPIPWHTAGSDNEEMAQAELRIWKLLRELDVPPVFLPHVKRELVSLLNIRLNRQLEQKLAKAAKQAMEKVFQKEEKTSQLKSDCHVCKKAKIQAEDIISSYRFSYGKAAKAVKRHLKSMLDIWKGDK